MDALKLLLVLALIVIGVRRKISVGPVLTVASVAIALLYAVNPSDYLTAQWELIKSERFISLTALVLLITSMGALLKELKYLDRLANAATGLWGGTRTAVVVLPPLVGLMPMPGGSLMSAPLVDDLMPNDRHKPEFKTVTNYWFRHIVEFTWPVYAGLILTEGITGLPIGSVALLQLPLTLSALVIGLFLFARKIEPRKNPQASAGSPGKNMLRSLIGILMGVWPIILAILIYAITRIDLAIAVLISIVALVMVARPDFRVIKAAVKEGFSYKLVLLIFGALSLQTSLEISGAIESLPQLSAQMNLPPQLLIVIVCFTTGLLTGMVSAYVALGFSLLAGFIYQPVLVPSNIFLGYLAGFIGVMLSPAHLCLILTTAYFKADLGNVYRTLIKPVLLLAAVGTAIYLSPWGELFVP